MYKYSYKGEPVTVTGDLGDKLEIKDGKGQILAIPKSELKFEQIPDKPIEEPGSGLTVKPLTEDAGDSGEGRNATMKDVHPERE